ncbi:MAG: carboxypeptidase regulatory-like domain-containing protein [bacterium]|nr:carboxypeptidase regulatory-like domain-containing protein [bacterium]
MAPAAPTNLTGVPVGNTQMRLNWSAPTTNDDGSPITDLASYNIYRSGNLVGTVAAGTTQYVDTPSQNDGYYAWTVTARDEVPNISDPSEPFTGAVVSPWEQIDYEWVDISQVGTPIQLDWWGDIDGPLDLGFNFPFLGDEYSQLWLSGMGWVSFIELFNGFFSNVNIPNGAEPHAAIYPFWDELYPEPTMGAQVLYFQDQAEDRFVISWLNVPHLFNTGVLYSFQLILGDDGSLIMNYMDIPVDWPGNAECTIGVEDATSTSGIPLYYMGVGEFAPASETAVAFWSGPSGAVTGIVREFGSNAPVADAMITVAQHPEFFTTSDVTGVYLLEVEPGTYTINIHKQGYCDQQITNIVVVDDGTVTQNFSLRQPNAQFDVTSLNILAVTGQNATSQFEITNPGATCELEYTITTNQTWLTVNPATGEVPSNGSVIINVTGATANFNPGDFTATISVAHNDLNSPLAIPVTINVVSNADDSHELPTEFALNANYPNPFNATTVLSFDVPQESRVELVVFNVQGQEIARPVDQVMSAGRHSINYAADGLPSGMYLVKMTSGNFTGVQKIVLLK